MSMYIYEICPRCGKIMSKQTTTGTAGTTESQSYRRAKKPCGSCGEASGGKVDKKQEKR